jgi:hypothetical protein
MQAPPTHYAQTSDDVSIAYQVTGVGPVDLVFVNGLFGHIEAAYDLPGYGEFMRPYSADAPRAKE